MMPTSRGRRNFSMTEAFRRMEERPAWITQRIGLVPTGPLRLERDPSQPIGIPCPDCGLRPAMRFGSYAEPRWECSKCKTDFTLADVLRYLWNRKS